MIGPFVWRTLVRVQGRLESLDDIGRLVVHATPQAQVRIADVARVQTAAAEVKHGCEIVPRQAG